MNYKWAKDFTLQLIDQYSTAGSLTPESYNNQADYVVKIPNLLNEALSYASSVVRRIRSTVPLSELEHTPNGDWMLYTLPEDCMGIMGGGLVRFTGDSMQRFHRYHLVGADRIAIPSTIPSDVLLEYFRRPKLLSSKPFDDDELDGVQEVQMVLPYYAAAHLAIHDNAFAYQALMNEFESKLLRLGEQQQTELNVVEDAYSASEWEETGW